MAEHGGTRVVPITGAFEAHDTDHGRTVASTVAHGESEDSNEDAGALIVLPRGVVLLVADGVGGSPAGREAARTTRQAVCDAFVRRPEGQGYREAALDGFERANQAVLDLGVGAATTLSLVVIEDDVARSFHAGDSTVLIVGQRGRIKHWTVSHSPVGYAVEAGMLAEDEARSHEERNVVLNLLGSRDMRIELGPPVKLAARDTVLVASDGLFDNLGADEIVHTVRKGPLDPAAQQLRERSLQRMTCEEPPAGKPDDLTFLMHRPRYSP